MNEISAMKGTSAQVEKDGLLRSIDNKSERVAAFERELKAEEGRLLKMEKALTET
jgi:hypothetical protein